MLPQIRPAEMPIVFDEEHESVTIRDLEIQSRDVYDHLSKAGEPVEEAKRAVQVGCISLSRVNASNQVDFVAARTRQLLSDVAGSLQTAEKGFQEYVQKTREEMWAGQQRLLAEFDPDRKTSLATKLEDQFMSKIKNLEGVIAVTFGNDGLATKAVQKAQTEGHEGLRKEFQSLRDFVTDQLASLRSPEKASYAIGLAFEDACKAKLDEFCKASLFGLVLTDCRTMPGIMKSKKGDFTIVSDETGLICLEMKNKDMTLPACLLEMEEAESNRGAAVTVLVGEESSLPAGVGAYNEYGHNKIICTIEVLAVALKIALLKARKIKVEETGDNKKANLVQALSLSEELVNSLFKFNRIRHQCQAIRKASTKLEEATEELKDELSGKAEELVETLSGKDKEVQDD